MNEGILIGDSDAGQIFLNPCYANRHGLGLGAAEAFIKSMARSLSSTAGSSMGKKFFRGVLGSLLK